MIRNAYANHGEFGLYYMSGPDAVLWSLLGLLAGAILIFLWRRRMFGRRKDEDQ